MKLLNNTLKKNKIEKDSYLYDILKLKKFINKYIKIINYNNSNMQFRSKITNHRQQWVNNIFNYNSNNMINIAQHDKIINNLIASYFNLYNKEIEKNKAKVRFYKAKYRKKSSKKIFFNFSNAKHTNNLITLNLFTYNRYNKSINKKLKKLDNFYKARFKFNDTKLNTKDYIIPKKYIRPKKYRILKRYIKNNILLKKKNYWENLNRHNKKDFIKDIKLNYKFIFNKQLKDKIKIHKYNNKVLNKNFEYIKNTLTKNNINLYDPINIRYINKKFCYLNLSKNKKYSKLQKKIKTIIIVRKSKHINKNVLYNKYTDNIVEIKTLHTDSSKFDIKYYWNNKNKLTSNNKKFNKKNKLKHKKKKIILNINKKLKNKYPGKKELKKKYFILENKLIKNKLTKKQRLKYISQNKIKKYQLRKEINKLKKYQLTTNNKYLKQYVKNYLDNKTYSKLNKDVGYIKKEKKTKIKKFLKYVAKSKLKWLSMIEYSTLKKRVIFINKKKKRNFLKKFFYKKLKKNLKITLHKKNSTRRKNLKKFLYKNKRDIKNHIKEKIKKRKFISFRRKTRLKKFKKYTRILLLRQLIKLTKSIIILKIIKSPIVKWQFKNLSKYVFSKKRRLLFNILTIYRKHVYEAWLKSLEKKNLIVYYKQMSKINKLKFQDVFLIKLKNIISKLYKKNVKFNIIDLKYPVLDSSIFTQIISLKTAKQRRYLIRYILKRRALKKKKLRLKYPDVLIFKNRRKTKVSLKDLKPIYISKIINKKIKNKKIKNIRNINCKDILNSNINQYHNNINKIEDIVFSSLKNKYIKGIKIEANGRLTRRLVASRSVYKHRHLGTMKNFHSSYSGFYGYLLRGHSESYTQYTKLHSKTRNGSFGLKGWISTI